MVECCRLIASICPTEEVCGHEGNEDNMQVEGRFSFLFAEIRGTKYPSLRRNNDASYVHSAMTSFPPVLYFLLQSDSTHIVLVWDML